MEPLPRDSPVCFLNTSQKGFLYFPNQAIQFLVFSVHRLNYTVTDHFRGVIAYKQNFSIITVTKFSRSKIGIRGQTEDMWPLPSQGTCSRYRFLLQNPFQVIPESLYLFTWLNYTINTLHGSFLSSVEALSSPSSLYKGSKQSVEPISLGKPHETTISNESYH